jgi:hypothetical protein
MQRVLAVMVVAMQIAFETLRLRANPAYRAVAWNRLPPEAGGNLARTADSFGVLLPVEGWDLPPIAIDHDTALLFFSLVDPGPAPKFAYAGHDASAVLHRLIFDSVLQLEHGNTFISGPEAWAQLGIQHIGRDDALMKVSMEALACAAALPLMDPATLARKLYTYNTRPTTGVLRRRWSDKAACLALLGLAPESETRNTIARLWSSIDGDSSWLVFQRHRRRERVIQLCKLYIGLTFEEIAEGLKVIAETLSRHDTLQFKVGADLDGLLRPDKFVAYFPGKDALLAAAQDLLPIVAGRKVHIVPFTAGITPSGALSWGMDPQNTWFGDRVSWRQWICEKLASGLIAARNSNSECIAPSQFALERLRLDGVDADTFMPTGMWSGAT